MADFAMFAQRLIADKLIGGEELFWTQANKLGIGFAILAGLLAFLGLGFLIFAFHLWLQAHYNPETSAALMGTIVLVLAFLFAVFTFAILQARRNRLQKLHREIKDTIHATFEALDEELTDPVGENPKISVLLASLAGFAAGGKFH